MVVLHLHKKTAQGYSSAVGTVLIASALQQLSLADVTPVHSRGVEELHCIQADIAMHDTADVIR